MWWSLFWFNPNNDSYLYPLISICLGGVAKHVLGGIVFDYLGHWLFVVGAFNLLYYVQHDRINKLPFFITLLLAVSLIAAAQIVLLQIFDNFTPLLG